MSRSRRKQRQSLAGYKWRVMGRIEKELINILFENRKLVDERYMQFIASIQSKTSISVRQKWYLAFIASRYAKYAILNDEQAEWMNDVLSQDCPEGFTSRSNMTISPKSPINMPVVPQPAVLIGAQRKIRE